MSSFLPAVKITNLESFSDIVNFFRSLTTKKSVSLKHRDKRPYILAESTKFVKNEEVNSSAGCLVISGYVRGQTLCAEDFVHIPGWKDFKLKKIEVLSDPYKATTRKTNGDSLLRTVNPDPSKQVH